MQWIKRDDNRALPPIIVYRKSDPVCRTFVDVNDSGRMQPFGMETIKH